MKYTVESSPIVGEVLAPPSKSHTIRAAFFAALAEGESIITNPLESADTRSAVNAIKMLGADVDLSNGDWRITGAAGRVGAPRTSIDVGNSGTTARFVISMASLGLTPILIKGDSQTSSRPMGPLLNALIRLGARVTASNGKLPATIEGPISGGETEVDGTTSQYLSSLLIHTPLAPYDTVLKLLELNEKPYVDMTLRWLDQLDIEYEREGYSLFKVRGRQEYSSFNKVIPGDFSSATFFACLGAIPGNSVAILGLDFEDSQGDKVIFDYLEAMGAKVEHQKDRVFVTGQNLEAVDLDLNDTPDALPAISALASLAKGKTTLCNVPQARIKETDRISVMAEELSKMCIKTEETIDSLIIHGGKPKGAKVSGHGDHRIVMSLALVASAAKGITTIDSAEAVNITFPNFANMFLQAGGIISQSE
ncbi:MAG TPA: 3-phosphoshikimate 1-carboxyvinyltransferase [Nitrospinota bacterium]|nr:3-phosphoshikimate 1-carboxyvinyltransferase [Nitrospinota bacterium]|tara:strand:+ start:202578 stop:203843 length:1266 start_codon:yes stop_codon:yes gene_type:complete